MAWPQVSLPSSPVIRSWQRLDRHPSRSYLAKGGALRSRAPLPQWATTWASFSTATPAETTSAGSGDSLAGHSQAEFAPVPPNTAFQPTPLRGPKIGGILKGNFMLTLVPINGGGAAEC